MCENIENSVFRCCGQFLENFPVKIVWNLYSLVSLIRYRHQISRPKFVTVPKESDSFRFCSFACSVGRFTARYSLFKRIQLFIAEIFNICTSIEAILLITNIQITNVLFQLRFRAMVAVARLDTHFHVWLFTLPFQRQQPRTPSIFTAYNTIFLSFFYFVRKKIQLA
jgi:hypothetical protein